MTQYLSDMSHRLLHRLHITIYGEIRQKECSSSKQYVKTGATVMSLVKLWQWAGKMKSKQIFMTYFIQLNICIVEKQ